MLTFLANFFTGGVLDRVLDTVDKKFENEANRDAIKGDVIKAHMASRGDWMRAGGFWLLVLWSLPWLFWAAAVIVYSVFWCQGCAYPQEWTIAALPAPLDEWGQWIMLASIGGLGLSQLRK